MKSNSLGRLQTEIIKLEQENLKLKDKLEEAQKKNKLLEQKIKYLENNVEQKVKVAVEKLVKDILIENEELKAENAKLKKILNTDSSNSGIPTSKTKIGETKRIPNSREKSNKTKGGQEGHKKHKLEKFKDEEITDTYTYEIANPICKCGGKLKLTGKRYKDEFDIEIRLIKRRNEFCEYECVKCGREIKVPIPNNLKEENQYGSNVQAIALSLVNEGCVSFKRTRELICGFSGGEMNISEGYLVKLQKRSYDNLEAFEKEMYQKILKQKLIYWDDTVITINGKQSCLRFYGNEQIKYYKSHETKSKDGLDNDGILKYLSEDTVVEHDHLKVNYNNEYNFINAECCVHLIRDLKKINDNLPREWINKLITLLVETNKKRNDYINKNILLFNQEVSDKVIAEYDEIIKEAEEINKKDFNQYHGADEKKIINRLKEYKENYLLWVLRFDVPFSNNLSERSLRSSKTKMKVSGQFANIKNAEYYARIKSYIETSKANGINVHIALRRLTENNPYTLNEILNNTKEDAN